MMTKKELTSGIASISNRADTAAATLEKIEQFLSKEGDDARLLLRHPRHGQSVFADPEIATFLESRNYPLRGVYTAQIARSGGDSAVLALCLGSFGTSAESAQHAVDVAAQHLAQKLSNVRQEAA
jgi:hypothetical protein